MDILLLRFEAPLISFGAPIVDRYGTVQPYPALSMLAGMLGNALGYSHAQTDRLQRLQQRLRCASRRDRAGRRIRDYQIVDLNQPFMRDDRAWTTHGSLQLREGGDAPKWRKGKGNYHQRLRDYWADSAHTIALTLAPRDEDPTVERLTEALRRPERPLFIGRKTCLPAAPLFLGRVETENLVEALRTAPLAEEPDSAERLTAWWPAETPGAEGARPVTDRRDWKNQIHVGERWITSGEIDIETKEANHA
jgi:CRISPR system Cascade subunit CasD